MFSRMVRTIFLRIPISKQKCIFLTIAVICLLGYLALKRTKQGLKPLKPLVDVGRSKHVAGNKLSKNKATGPSMTMDEKDFLLDGKLVGRSKHVAGNKLSKNKATGPSMTMDEKDFLLDGKPVRILSGAIHYFRVVPEYWRDRLLKLKAMGLNTVETYVAWNLHEEIKGQFNFDGILDLGAFIKLAQELNLYVIVRPGPYICSEWDFGGLPSWLLHDPQMEPRSMYHPFIEATDRYFNSLLPILVPLQYSKGGPIIAFQIENEYGSHYTDDVNYLNHLKSLMIDGGITELLFTSDNSGGLNKRFLSLPNVLKTVNFGNGAEWKLNNLVTELQPGKPAMVAEFWDGWFDHWGEEHHTRDTEKVASNMEEILKFGASVNLYMFHGGTNFGFMNGANALQPTTTSYDYDAPLSEAGDITPKYKALRNVLRQYDPNHSFPDHIPAVPKNSSKKAYGNVEVKERMPLSELLRLHTPIKSDKVMPMERLPINNGGGQGYGFILYQTILQKFPKEIVMEDVLDRAQVLLDSLSIHTYDASLEEEMIVEVHVDEKLASVVNDPYKLEILVENMGRTNIGWNLKKLRKGINGKVEIDGQSNTNHLWKIFSLDFKEDMLARIKKQGRWSALSDKAERGPTLYRTTFIIDDDPKDTFLCMKGWTKGVCFINGHNLGRYWKRGPQKTLYVPAPWLRKGENELIIFELHEFQRPRVSFTASPIFV